MPTPEPEKQIIPALTLEKPVAAPKQTVETPVIDPVMSLVREVLAKDKNTAITSALLLVFPDKAVPEKIKELTPEQAKALHDIFIQEILLVKTVLSENFAVYNTALLALPTLCAIAARPQLEECIVQLIDYNATQDPNDKTLNNIIAQLTDISKRVASFDDAVIESVRKELQTLLGADYTLPEDFSDLVYDTLIALAEFHPINFCDLTDDMEPILDPDYYIILSSGYRVDGRRLAEFCEYAEQEEIFITDADKETIEAILADLPVENDAANGADPQASEVVLTTLPTQTSSPTDSSPKTQHATVHTAAHRETNTSEESLLYITKVAAALKKYDVETSGWNFVKSVRSIKSKELRAELLGGIKCQNKISAQQIETFLKSKIAEAGLDPISSRLGRKLKEQNILPENTATKSTTTQKFSGR